MEWHQGTGVCEGGGMVESQMKARGGRGRRTEMEFTGGLATYLLERVIFRSYGVEGERWNLEGRERGGRRAREETVLIGTKGSIRRTLKKQKNSTSDYAMFECVYLGEGKNGKKENFSHRTTSIVREREREFLSVDTYSDCVLVLEACVPKPAACLRA